MTDRTTADPLRLLSLREAAAVLGLDWKSVRELVETGQIGAYRTGATGQHRIPRLALVAWQERIARGAAAPLPSADYPLGRSSGDFHPRTPAFSPAGHRTSRSGSVA